MNLCKHKDSKNNNFPSCNLKFYENNFFPKLKKNEKSTLFYKHIHKFP